MADSANNNINIPMELVVIILVRLSIKSLSQFKCVCKSWYLLIQSQEFFKLHLNQSLRRDSYNCSLILPITRNLVVNGTPTAVSSLYRAYLSLNQTQLEIRKISLPPSFQTSPEKLSRCDNNILSRTGGKGMVYGKIEIGGSCNGLVLILSGMHHFVVFNPAIENERAFKILPCITYPDHFYYYYPTHYGIYSAPQKSRSFLHRVFGFGYDSVTCTYKIVYLSIERVLVYSLARDDHSWRTIDLPLHIIKYDLTRRYGDHQEPQLLMLMYGNGIATNNHLHWNITEYDPKISDYSREVILSFDVCNEEWGEVSLPDELVKGFRFISGFVMKPYVIELGVLDGCLCLLSSTGAMTRHPNLELWIMKEYGVTESWTLLCEVPNGSGIPLFYRKDRYEFLLPGMEHGLGWFNPRDNKIRKVEFHGCEFSGENYYSNRGRMCIESFVDPFSSMNTV